MLWSWDHKLPFGFSRRHCLQIHLFYSQVFIARCQGVKVNLRRWNVLLWNPLDGWDRWATLGALFYVTVMSSFLFCTRERLWVLAPPELLLPLAHLQCSLQKPGLNVCVWGQGDFFFHSTMNCYLAREILVCLLWRGKKQNKTIVLVAHASLE